MSTPVTSLFALPRLNSGVGVLTVTEAAPWLTPPPRPPGIADGKALKKWVTSDPASEWVCLSAFGGESRTGRVSTANPPAVMRGFIADYDKAFDMQKDLPTLRKRLEKHPPTIVHPSPTGKVRVIWVFAEEVRVNHERAEQVTRTLVEEWDLEHAWDAFDKASLKPSQYFLWYGQMGEFHFDDAARVDLITLEGLMIEADKKVQWKKYGDVNLPLDAVARALGDTYSDFNAKWNGPFAVGARGPRFWDKNATNPSACIVHEGGIVSFSDDVLFRSWSDLLGKDWVKDFRTQRTVKAVEGIYYDGRQFWRREAPGRFLPDERATIVNLLENRGLSTTARKNELSEIKSARYHIEIDKRVQGVLPFHFVRREVVELDGRTFLNNSQARAIEPDERYDVEMPDAVWQVLHSVFVPPDKDLVPDGWKGLCHFLAWLRHFYAAAHNGIDPRQPHQGQAVVLCGPARCGKTFIVRHILKPMFGGGANAEKLLMGETSFTSDAYDKALLVMDDPKESMSAKENGYMTECIKALVAASDSAEYSKKYGAHTTFTWTGRVVVCLNNDAESVRLLPDITRSFHDKVHLFKVCSDPSPEGQACASEIFDGKTVESALPQFARWLLTWDPEAAGVETDPRFGYRAYHDPELAEQSQEQSPIMHLREMLTTLGSNRQGYSTTPRGPLTTSGILDWLHENHEAGSARYTPNGLSRLLNSLSTQYPREFSKTKGRGNTTLWTIHEWDA